MKQGMIGLFVIGLCGCSTLGSKEEWTRYHNVIWNYDMTTTLYNVRVDLDSKDIYYLNTSQVHFTLKDNIPSNENYNDFYVGVNDYLLVIYAI